MINERIMILEMIKDGKISVDDGVKLLNALNKNSSSNFNDFKNDLKYKFNNIPKPNTEKIKEGAQVLFNKTEVLFDDFTKSVKDFFNTNEIKENNTQEDKVININPEDNSIEDKNKDNFYNN